MEREAFEYFYRKYLKRIERYIQVSYNVDPFDAEELTDEVFVLLLHKWDEFYSLEERGVVSWLYETAKRKAMAFNRKENKNPPAISFDECISTDAYTTNQSEFLFEEDFGQISEEEKYKNYIDEIKTALNEKEKEIFCLIVEQEMDYSKLSDILNISEVNARVRWHRVREKIKRNLPNLIK